MQRFVVLKRIGVSEWIFCADSENDLQNSLSRQVYSQMTEMWKFKIPLFFNDIAIWQRL